SSLFRVIDFTTTEVLAPRSGGEKPRPAVYHRPVTSTAASSVESRSSHVGLGLTFMTFRAISHAQGARVEKHPSHARRGCFFMNLRGLFSALWMPVEQERDGGGGGFFHQLVDQEPTVARDGVLWSVDDPDVTTQNACRKQRHRSSRFERGARRRDRHGHQHS